MSHDGLAWAAPWRADDGPFRPLPACGGGHRQTLLGFWARRRLSWTLPVEDLVVDAGDGVRLLARASWQPGPRHARPALLLVHGLGGSDQSAYMLATGRHAWDWGWHVLRLNMRGAGDGETVCPRLYNAGLDTDVLAAARAALRECPRVAIAGFSLGGGIGLLALGRRAAEIPAGVLGLAAVCAPLDLAACAVALARRRNRLYQHYFMSKLRADYARLQRLAPELYEAGRERRTRTVREFDEAITAPYGGYADVDDYYARSSAGPHLVSIDRPTLVLAAVDDPMIPCDSVARWPLPPSGLVRREIVTTGGHVGFVSPCPAPGSFWAAWRVMRFLSGLVGDIRP